MKTRLPVLSLVAALALSATALAGCASANDGAQPATAASAMTKAPVATSSQGPVRFLGEALADVPLRADQRTRIEALAKEADARHAGIATSRADFARALADQIEKGAVDEAALLPQVDAAAAAYGQVQDADRKAIEELHAILDASQRAALVDALEARFKDGMKRHHEGHASGGKGDHGPRGKMAEWAQDLALTDAQQDKIKEAFRAQMREMHDAHEAGADHHGKHFGEGRAHAKAALEAFKGDTFSLDAVAPKKDPKEVGRAMAHRAVTMVKLVVPELTQEQRVKAASKIRAQGELFEGH